MRATDIALGGLHFPEGPVLLDDGGVAVCEQGEGRLLRFDGAAAHVLADTGGSPNGAALGRDGLYVAQNGGLLRQDPAARAATPPGVQVVRGSGLDRVPAGDALRTPNDLAFGPDGRLYVTDPGPDFPPREGSPGFVAVISPDGTVERTPVGSVYPNGIGFLGDGTLVWVESATRQCMAMIGGAPSCLFTLSRGVPDGFAVAVDGSMFIATTYSHGVTVIDNAGVESDFIHLADDALPTNCCLGDGVLWVTDAGPYPEVLAGGRLWRIEVDAGPLPLDRGDF